MCSSKNCIGRHFIPFFRNFICSSQSWHDFKRIQKKYFYRFAIDQELKTKITIFYHSMQAVGAYNLVQSTQWACIQKKIYFFHSLVYLVFCLCVFIFCLPFFLFIDTNTIIIIINTNTKFIFFRKIIYFT